MIKIIIISNKLHLIIIITFNYLQKKFTFINIFIIGLSYLFDLYI